jgi:hypothetical protein
MQGNGMKNCQYRKSAMRWRLVRCLKKHE